MADTTSPVAATQRFSERVQAFASERLGRAAGSLRAGGVEGALALLNEVEDDLRTQERALRRSLGDDAP